jgi:membrane associated rhomboid family serine protease
MLCAVWPAARAAMLLEPWRVFAGLALWQPVTYLFIDATPFGVLMSALILFGLGGVLEVRWGPKRYLAFLCGVGAAAGFATAALHTVLPQYVAPVYPGGTVLSGTLWVAFGLTFGRSALGFWGLPVTGNTFALLGVALVVLNAAFYGLPAVIPEAIALAIAFVALRWRGPVNPWTRFRSWQLTRKLLRGGPRLHVVDGRPADASKPGGYLN